MSGKMASLVAANVASQSLTPENVKTMSTVAMVAIAAIVVVILVLLLTSGSSSAFYFSK